ncbi:MAG: MarR family transcriptional regulator [Pseudomonadota bacterium]
MTEINDISEKLPEPVLNFILQWGELGGAWGVNRSIGQIHALLYAADKPMTADQIVDRLGIARSNVSNSLKELVSWKLVRRVPIQGERKEHFAAETDLWEIAALIAKGRKEREIDPAMEVLQACSEQAQNDPNVDPAVKQRLEDMHEFIASVDKWFDQMMKLSRGQREMMLKLGSRVVSLLPGSKEK